MCAESNKHTDSQTNIKTKKQTGDIKRDEDR